MIKKMHKQHLDIAPFHTRSEKMPFCFKIWQAPSSKFVAVSDQRAGRWRFTGLTALGLDDNTNLTGRSHLTRVKKRDVQNIW